MPHLSQELAQFIYQLRPDDIPTSGTAAVRLGISDYMGVMFAERSFAYKTSSLTSFTGNSKRTVRIKRLATS